MNTTINNMCSDDSKIGQSVIGNTDNISENVNEDTEIKQVNEDTEIKQVNEELTSKKSLKLKNTILTVKPKISLKKK